ncbi:hypothetical protein AgCh_014882 [Apium graveolens]
MEKIATKEVESTVMICSQLRLHIPERRSALDVNEVALPAKGGRVLLRIFKELKQSVTNDWGAVKPPVVEEDKEFLERKGKLQDFENRIGNASQQQEIGETMGQLGLAFVKLTKFEADEAMLNSQRVRSADMKNVATEGFLAHKRRKNDISLSATAAVKANRLYRELNAQTVKHLDKLHDYLGVMLAINNAFSDRANALLTVQTLLSELASLNVRIENLEAASSKIFCGERSRIRKIDELKETVRVTEEAKTCAVREYERIKGQPDSYHELIGNPHHTERQAPDEVAMLVTSLKALSGAVSYIDSDHHKMLLSSISGMSLWNYGPDVMDVLVELVVALICCSERKIPPSMLGYAFPLAPLRLEKVIKERMPHRSSKQPWIAKPPFSFLASASP